MERVWTTKVSIAIIVVICVILYFKHRAAILIVTNENEKNVFDIGNIELKMALE